MNKEEIGTILKDLRNASNLTQKEVAEIIGRKQQIVGHWETGYSQPDANTLFTLCEIYDTTVDKAFGFNKKEFHISNSDLRLLEKYRDLDDHGKEMVDFTLLKEWERSISARGTSNIHDFSTASPLIAESDNPYYVNAAHAIPGASEEDQQHDDDIMNDVDF